MQDRDGHMAASRDNEALAAHGIVLAEGGLGFRMSILQEGDADFYVEPGRVGHDYRPLHSKTFDGERPELARADGVESHSGDVVERYRQRQYMPTGNDM